jgi:hypothetical protein
MAVSYEEIYRALDETKNKELSIIKISEPISTAINQAAGTRTSDVSDAFECPTPSSLEADLSHYKVFISSTIGTKCIANFSRNSSRNSASLISNKSRKRNSYAPLSAIHLS